MSLTEEMTSAASIPSVLLSSMLQPIYCFCINPVLPAISSTNLKASHICCKALVRSSPIVISASKPDCRQSCSMKVVPWRRSKSNEIDLNLHMWKNVLYYIFDIPGCDRYRQYMKVRFSEKSCLALTEEAVEDFPERPDVYLEDYD